MLIAFRWENKTIFVNVFARIFYSGKNWHNKNIYVVCVIYKYGSQIWKEFILFKVWRMLLARKIAPAQVRVHPEAGEREAAQSDICAE